MNKAILGIIALFAIIILYNCSPIEENNDPIIGIWSNEDNISTTNKTTENTSRQEWIFNDAYLGRYHSYNNNVISFKTDYRWVQKDNVYTISYPGTDFPEDIVIMTIVDNKTMLKDTDGNILAIRE